MTITSAAFADLYTAVDALPWHEPPSLCEVAVFSYDSQLKQLSRDPILITDDSKTFSGIDEIKLIEQPAENQRAFTQADLDNHAADELSRCYVGYDVEYTPLPPKDGRHDAELVSHQFYVAYNGARKAFILLTNERLHESEFVDLVAHIVPSDLKKVYVVAHFSLIECGWLLQDNVPTFRNRHLTDFHSNPTTYLPLLVASAYIKNLINHIFLEAPSKPANLTSKSYLTLSEFEEHVSPAYDDDYAPADTSSIPDDIKQKIIDSKSPRSALYDVTNGKIPLFPMRAELSEFIKETRKMRPVIEKLEKSWFGKIRLVKKETLDDYTNSAQQVLNIALEEMADKLGLPYSTVSIPKLGETDEARQQREARAADRARQLREKYQKSVLDWLATGDEASWQFVARRNAKGKRINRSEELKAHDRSLPETNLVFVDSNKFGATSLLDLGGIIKIGKIEIDESDISDMKVMLSREKQKFCEYAIRDSVVAAEAVAWFARICRVELGLDLKTRVAAYSAAYFKRALEEKVYNVQRLKTSGLKWNQNVKFCLGWTPPPKKVEKAKRSQLERFAMQGESSLWTPSIQMQQFARFFAGGWGAVFKVGSLGQCTYWDLKSAYPCAFMMLDHDYHFAYPLSFHEEKAEQMAREMVAKDSPFQIAGLEVAFEFKDTIIDEETGKEIKVEPFFPIRLVESDVSPLLTAEPDSTLIFTKSGTTNVMFPEYYTAVKMKLLKWHKVLSLETYTTIKDYDSTGKLVPAPSVFAKEVRKAIQARGQKGRKAIYKSLLNFVYGKFCEGIRKQTVFTKAGRFNKKRFPGPLTNFPMAAYATSVCRSVMGEFLNNGNECYAITTDGYVSPVMDELRKGEIGLKTHEALKDFIDEDKNQKYSYVEASYRGKESLFIKNHGYMLHGEDDNKQETVKIALMSAQTKDVQNVEAGTADPRAVEFMEALRTGKFTKRSFHGFKVIRADGKNHKPLQRESESNLSTSFDMKRIPLEPIASSTFPYYGHSYDHPQFPTRPLLNKNEYIKARKQLRPKFEVNDYHDFAARFLKRTIPVTVTGKAPVICLCGSTKHKKAMLDVASGLTLDGNVVLMPMVFSHTDGTVLSADQIDLLHQLHRQKIGLCDQVFVVNPGGYIGESTREEIEYAESLSKDIQYLNDVTDSEEAVELIDPAGQDDPDDELDGSDDWSVQDGLDNPYDEDEQSEHYDGHDDMDDR